MLIYEKIRDGKAVIADTEGGFTSVSPSLIDGDIGDVLIFDGQHYRCDSAATERRRNDIIRLQDSLWE